MPNRRFRQRDWQWARLLVVSSILLLSVAPLAGIAKAYSDATQEIHRNTSCPSDGFCQPEFYVVLDDPLINGTVEVDYLPAIDPHYWIINVTGILNITVDAQENYDTQGCDVFFQDCPDTTHEAWLTAASQCVLVVSLTTDVPMSWRAVNVPQPDQVLIDGGNASFIRWPDGIEVTGISAGTHELVFTNPVCDACGRSVGPGITLITFIMVSLWIAFAIFGLLLSEGIIGGLLVIMAGVIGLILALTYMVPCVPGSVSLLVLGLAILTLVFGMGLSIGGREE